MEGGGITDFMVKNKQKLCVIMIGALVLLSTFLSTAVVQASDSIDIERMEKSNIQLPVTGLGVSLPSPEFRTVSIEDGTYTMIQKNYESASLGIGKPDLPAFAYWIMIPSGTELRLEIKEGSYDTYSDFNIIPVQSPRPYCTDGGNELERSFDKNTSVYERDEFYPNMFAEIKATRTYRNHSLAQVWLYPYQYNPTRGVMNVYSELEVSIHFEGEVEDIPKRYHSSSTENFLRRIAVNTDQVLEVQPYTQTETDFITLPNAEFLIITHEDFEAAANKLAEWRIKTGIPTHVHVIDHEEDTADDIANYIQDAYDQWMIPPSYLLILGDADFVPTHYKTDHPSHNFDGKIGTDLYYATMEDSEYDYFPDLAHGRISVRTATQAETRVEGIINYEKEPVDDSSFYENVATVAQFQENPNYLGMADRRFTQTSEDISLFLEDEGYLVNRIYEYTPYWPGDPMGPEKWSDKSSNFGGGLAGEPGEEIPSHLSDDWTRDWDEREIWYDSELGNCPTENITLTVNDGAFLLTHRNHGNATDWQVPHYNTDHVLALSNSNALPVVWSINCATGHFDNETGEPEDHGMSFSEAWERNPNGGAIGVIAATRISYSWHNDRLTWGLMDAIWPDFVSNYGNGDPIYRMGNVLNYGKEYYSTHYPDDILRQSTFEMFHWFGDPTTEIRTAPPQDFSVTHPSMVLTSDPIMIQVKDDIGSPIEGAFVTMSEGTEIHDSGYTDSAGEVIFDAPNNPGEVNLTVTKHNYVPYVSTISIVDQYPSPHVNIYYPGQGQTVWGPIVSVEWESDTHPHAIDYFEIRRQYEGGSWLSWINKGESTYHVYDDLFTGEWGVQVRITTINNEIDVDTVTFNVLTDWGPMSIDSVDVQDSLVTVEWNLHSSDVIEVDRYEIRLKNGEWLNVGTSTSHTFRDLEERRYTVTVRMWDSDGNSWQDTAVFSVGDSPP